MAGFQECLDLRWLKVIIDWQQAEGCWSDNPSEISAPQPSPSSHFRRKREEKVLEHGCRAHKTAVAISALVQYVKNIAAEFLFTK